MARNKGTFSVSIISTLCNFTRILIRIPILLLAELLVVLRFFELLTNQGSGTGVQAWQLLQTSQKMAILNLQTQTFFSE